MTGWIKVFTGPMFSRKTEELLIELQRYMFAKKHIILFKHRIDDRHGIDVISHDGRKMPAINVSSSSELLKESEGYDIIGIDEAQFFDEGIMDVAIKLADSGKRVIMAGLDKNFLDKPFGPMPELLSIADEVIKLTAICAVCGEPATFSKRLATSRNEILIGGIGFYEPRCRSHRNQ